MARTKTAARSINPTAGLHKKNLSTCKQPQSEDSVSKKKRRFRSGTVALREIRTQQKSTKPILRFLPFSRLVREITQDLDPETDYMFQASAMYQLREAAEDYLIKLFDASYVISLCRNNVTLQKKDLEAVQEIRKKSATTSTA